MNGFEPLRRMVIDYTDAGQWEGVYDGPLDECYEVRLKTENDELRELVRELYEDQCDECDRWRYNDRLQALGIEVE